MHARREAYGELIQNSYYEALLEHKLNAVGDPAIDIKDEEGSFSYVAEFEVIPEITISDLADAELERPVAELLDSDVDGMIEKLRQQRVTWNKVERAARDGDQLMISFYGMIVTWFTYHPIPSTTKRSCHTALRPCLVLRGICT